MNRVRAGIVAVAAAYACFVSYQLGYNVRPALAEPNAGAQNQGTGCGACHGSVDGQAYVISGSQLFPTGPILPNGPTVAAGAYHDNTASGTYGGGSIGGTHYSVGGAGVW